MEKTNNESIVEPRKKTFVELFNILKDEKDPTIRAIAKQESIELFREMGRKKEERRKELKERCKQMRAIYTM